MVTAKLAAHRKGKIMDKEATTICLQRDTLTLSPSGIISSDLPDIGSIKPEHIKQITGVVSDLSYINKQISCSFKIISSNDIYIINYVANYSIDNISKNGSSDPSNWIMDFKVRTSTTESYIVSYRNEAELLDYVKTSKGAVSLKEYRNQWVDMWITGDKINKDECQQR